MDRHQSGRPVHSEVCPTWITVFRFSRCPTAASLLSVFSLLPEMKYVSLINAHPHTRCYTCSPQLTAVGKVKKKKRIRLSQQSRPDCESCLKSFPLLPSNSPVFGKLAWEVAETTTYGKCEGDGGRLSPSPVLPPAARVSERGYSALRFRRNVRQRQSTSTDETFGSTWRNMRTRQIPFC